MAKGIDELYDGTEQWDVQTQSAQYITDFENQNTTRKAVLDRSEYDPATTPPHPNITVFLSERTILDVTGVSAGTRRPNVVGVVVLFGYENNNLVLITRSANGRAARPAGADFTNFNYKNANTHVLDSEVDILTANFRANGYGLLRNWPNNSHPAITIDHYTLLRLLYSDASPTVTDKTVMHVAIAPPSSGDNSGLTYITLIAQSGNTSRGNPECPPHCYQNF